MRTERAGERPTILCFEPIEIFYDRTSQLFIVDDPSLDFRRAIPPHVLEASIANGAIAYRAYKDRRGAEVIAFPDRAKAV
jgi:hypothetical protein